MLVSTVPFLARQYARQYGALSRSSVRASVRASVRNLFFVSTRTLFSVNGALFSSVRVPLFSSEPAEQMAPEVKRTYLNKLSVKFMNIYIKTGPAPEGGVGQNIIYHRVLTEFI